MVKTKQLKKTLSKLWQNSLKEYDKMTKETSKMLKKGEENLKTASHTSKQRLEVINLSVKREKLYYQLGKTAAKQPKNLWPDNPKITSIVKELKKIGRGINKLTKKKKTCSKKR